MSIFSPDNSETKNILEGLREPIWKTECPDMSDEKPKPTEPARPSGKRYATASEMNKDFEIEKLKSKLSLYEKAFRKIKIKSTKVMEFLGIAFETEYRKGVKEGFRQCFDIVDNILEKARKV